MTVVLALLGMFIIPTTIFRSLATGAILVTLAALAASMTLLPAILGLLGDRINWPRLSKRARVDADHDPRGGVWDRITRGVMARPVVFLVGGVLVLGALGSFYFQLHRGTSQNVSQLSDDFPSKQAFLTLEREFSGGMTDPARDRDHRRRAERGRPGRDREPAGGDRATRRVRVADPGHDQQGRHRGRGGRVPRRATRPTTPRSRRSATCAARSCPSAFDGVNGVDVLVGGNTAFFTDFLDVVDTLPVDRAGVGAGAVVHPADRRVPVDRRAGDGDPHEPAVGRRRVRRADARVPEGRRDRDLQRDRVPVPEVRGDRGVAAAVPVLGPVRPVDGLPGVPDLADPRGVRQDGATTPRRLPTVCGRRPGSSPARR